MTKKSLKAYQHLLSYIQRSIIDLSQATFITDYETGLRSAIEKVSLIQEYLVAGSIIARHCVDS